MPGRCAGRAPTWTRAGSGSRQPLRRRHSWCMVTVSTTRSRTATTVVFPWVPNVRPAPGEREVTFPATVWLVDGDQVGRLAGLAALAATMDEESARPSAGPGTEELGARCMSISSAAEASSNRPGTGSTPSDALGPGRERGPTSDLGSELRACPVPRAVAASKPSECSGCEHRGDQGAARASAGLAKARSSRGQAAAASRRELRPTSTRSWSRAEPDRLSNRRRSPTRPGRSFGCWRSTRPGTRHHEGTLELLATAFRPGAQRRARRRLARSRSRSPATTPSTPYGTLTTSRPSGSMIPVTEP